MFHKYMNLNLSREQFITLLESVHLAGHVRGAVELDELEDVLLKCGMETGLDGIVMEEKGKLMLNNLILRALHEDIEEYDDETFQATLADELAARDLSFVKTAEEIESLTDDEYDEIIDSQALRYEAEFAEHGVDHLTLAHPLPLA
jgi:hypothetical protein